jgi:hypothetical protein
MHHGVSKYRVCRKGTWIGRHSVKLFAVTRESVSKFNVFYVTVTDRKKVSF